MAQPGWKSLVADWPWFDGSGRYPISAYSEFMPPPRLGLAPYGEVNPFLFREDDPAAGMSRSTRRPLSSVPVFLESPSTSWSPWCTSQMDARRTAFHRRSSSTIPIGPTPLAERKGQLAHERFVLLLSLSLARTQDDKGRVRWTLFGSSEQGPARAFWKSFFEAPGVELPEERALGVLRGLVSCRVRPARNTAHRSARRGSAHSSAARLP